MSKPNLIGRLLNAVRIERWRQKEQVVVDLWKRNGLDNPTRRDGYKIEESSRVDRSGNETTVYTLWKMVDQSELRINTTVSSEVITGIRKEESHVNSGGTPKTDDTSSPI